MKFVTFAGVQGTPTAGVLVDGRVADLSHPSCAPWLAGLAPSLPALLEAGLAPVARRLREVRFDADALRPLQDLTLLAPVPRPGKVVGAAHNFTDALAERGLPHPSEPRIFVRSGSTVVGPGAPILLPPDVGPVGYEAELAVVIGQRALRVDRASALAYVAGYTAHNDVTGSGLVQADGGDLLRGKNLPATAPLGPWLATADEVPDPQALSVRLDIDGRVLQRGSTATMLFDVAALISFISHRMPLDPGDVIATGTPAGVAAMHTPPAWLQPGATVTVEVEGLGRLVNPVAAGAPFLVAGC